MTDVLSTRQYAAAIAAGPVFLEHGYVQTTMSDLALAAGLSRQGLYLAFANKEAIFDAAVRVLDDQLHRDIAAGLGGVDGLERRLKVVCERWLSGVYDLQTTIPDARDMDDLTFPVVRRVYDRFISMVAGLICAEGDDATDEDEAHELARILMFAMRGFSDTALDGPDMRRLVARQIKLVVTAAAGA